MAGSSYRFALLFPLLHFSGAVQFVVPANCTASNDCAQAIQSAVSSCAGQTPCDIILQAGVYNISGQPFSSVFEFANVPGLSITGAGPTETLLLMQNIFTLFLINACDGFMLAEFSVDNARTPFTLGVVESVSAGVSTLTFDAATYPIDGTVNGWLSQAEAAIQYNLTSGRLARGGTDDYWLPPNQRPITFLSMSGPSAAFTLPAVFPVGAAMIIRHVVYGFNFATVQNSDDFAVHNVTLFSTPGMGVFTSNVSGVDLNGLEVIKAPGRPMSITADGTHFSNSRGGSVLVRHCTFEGQGDDGMNIPTIFMDIESVSADRRTLTLGKDGAVQSPGNIVVPGSTMNLFARETLLPQGTAVVAGITGNTLTLTAPLPPGVQQWDLVNNAASYADYVEVSDCIFKDNRARGALLKSSNVLATRNVFDHTTGPAIKTETDGCYWFEGHPVKNWTIFNNSFIGCNYATAATPGDVYIDHSVPVFQNGVPTEQCQFSSGAQLQANVTVSGNTFWQDAGQAAVVGYSISGAVVDGNVVTRLPGTPVPQFDLVCERCIDAIAGSNTCNGGPCNASGF